MYIDFPNREIPDLQTLKAVIATATDDVVINLNQDVYGELHLEKLMCNSITVNGNGKRWRGAIPIAVDMQVVSDNMLMGKLSSAYSFDRLMLDGNNLILARYPSVGTCTMADIVRRAQSWKIEGGRVRALHEREWGGNGYTLSNDSGKIKLDWIGNNNRGSGYKDGSLIVENIYEEVNSHQEWYYNKTNNRLFLYLEQAKAGVYNFDLLTHLDLLRISSCNTSKITINNINFCDTCGSMFNSSWQRYLRSDWAYNKSSAVTIVGSSNVDIINCKFNNLGNNAIGIYDKCQDVTICNSQFTDCMTGGVLILGDKESIYCTSSWDGDNHKANIENPSNIGAKSDQYPSKIGISGCYFFNLGQEDKQCAAVCISLASAVSVKNCTVHHMPRAGINIAENAFGGHSIVGNDIFDCVRETGDHGPFNSWGRDRFWSFKRFDTMGRYGKQKREFALIDMMGVNTIMNNRVCGHSGFGIDLDDGSSNYIIQNNFCCGVGIKLREGFYRKVTNNVLLGAPMDLHVSYWGNDDIVSNNVIVNPKAFRIIMPNSGNTTRIENNTIVNNTTKLPACVSRKSNKFIATLDDTLKQYVAKFSEREYGVKDAPKPSISYALQLNMAKRIKACGAKLVSMDDEKRSLCGAPDLDGLYVEKLSMFSRLAKLKVKAGDVIIAIDGINAKWQDIFKLSACNRLTIMRNQLVVELK